MKRICAVLCLAAVCCPAAGQQQGGVRTSRKGAKVLPLPREEGVFHFAIFGDRTSGPPEGIRVLERAVAGANLLGPDLVMTVGDLIQGYNPTGPWLRQMREYHRVMNRLKMRWFPVAGNHDVYWRGPGRPFHEHDDDYERHFGPLWYWFAHKNTAFVVLYTDEGDPITGRKGFRRPRRIRMSRAQLDWLAATLAETKKYEHVFVFCHHPRWIRRLYVGSNWDRVHALLLAAGNVSAVFAGHIHRMHYGGKRDGIEYFALATTGGRLAAHAPAAGYLHHMNVVTVRPRTFTVATIPVGAVVDPRVFTISFVEDVEKARRLSAAWTTAPLAFAPSWRVQGSCELRIDNPARRPLEIDVTADASGDWTIAPDHVHLRVDPGKSALVRLAISRWPGVLGGAFRMPQVRLAIDYLGAASRITLPGRALPLPLAIGRLGDPFFHGVAPGALLLKGKRDCLRLASRALRLADGPFTVEAWFSGRHFRGRRALIAKTQQSEFGIFVVGGRPGFSVHLDGRYVTAAGRPGSLRPGLWHHVAGVYDGREVRLYLDGALVAAAAGSGSRTRSQLPLYVGADPDGAGRPVSFFAGMIDEVRISSVVRYRGKEFVPARRHAPDDRTALLLHLDRDVGPFAADHSANAAHPLRIGAARCVPLKRVPE